LREATINAKEKLTLELPRLYYLGYNIILENENTITNIDYYENENGFVEIETNGAGTLKVKYEKTSLERRGQIISLVSVIMYLSLIVYLHKRKI